MNKSVRELSRRIRPVQCGSSLARPNGKKLETSKLKLNKSVRELSRRIRPVQCGSSTTVTCATGYAGTATYTATCGTGGTFNPITCAAEACITNTANGGTGNNAYTTDCGNVARPNVDIVKK